MQPTPIRRVITQNDAHGKSFILEDGPTPAVKEPKVELLPLAPAEAVVVEPNPPLPTITVCAEEID